MKRFLRAVLCLLAAVLLLSGSAVMAVSVTTRAFGEGEELTVAGIPDLAPLEEYDPAEGTYVGVLPALLAYAEEQTDCRFLYVFAGARDRRLELLRSGEADMVFATEDEKELLASAVSTVPMFTLSLEGRELRLYCCYSSAMAQTPRYRLRKLFSDLGADEVSLLYSRAQRRDDSRRAALAGAFAALELCILVLGALFSIKARNNRINKAIAAADAENHVSQSHAERSRPGQSV